MPCQTPSSLNVLQQCQQIRRPWSQAVRRHRRAVAVQRQQQLLGALAKSLAGRGSED